MTATRTKIPAWAMAVLCLLPLWVFMYAVALRPASTSAAGPLDVGAGVYASNCGGCHGDSGQGIGAAYPFVNGSVIATFPRIEDQLRWVSLGMRKYQDAGVQVYGSPKREGQVHVTGASGSEMPGWSDSLSDAEILAVVCHERYDLGGADKAGGYADEYSLWCAAESPIYAALLAGEASFVDVHIVFAAEGVIEVGAVPKPGSVR